MHAVSETWVEAVLDTLRRDGSVVASVSDLDDLDEWRRTVRQACRRAGLRVRTGVNANGVVRVEHVDHVVTDAEMQVAARAIDDVFSGSESRPFRELAREEQRKRMTIVRDESVETADERSAPGDVHSLVIDYSSRQTASNVDDERFLQSWYATITLAGDNGEAIEKVGSIWAYTVDYEEMVNTFDVLDDQTADLGHIAGVIFDPATGDMRPEMEDHIEFTGHGMLIIDSVWLEPSWRGHGLGPLLVGMVIEHLGAARQLVALQPAPTERRDGAGNVVEDISDAEREVAMEKLGELWAQVGFEHVDNNVWVLNMGLTTFTDQMAAIRDRLGLT